MRVLGIAVLLLLQGCLSVPGVRCENGVVCPEGFVCIEEAGRCGTLAEQQACEGATTGDACAVGGVHGTCQQGVCEPACGNGELNALEQCDFSEEGGGAASCIDLGYEMGATECTETCAFIEDHCVRFGFEIEETPDALVFYDDAWGTLQGAGEVLVAVGSPALDRFSGAIGTRIDGQWQYEFHDGHQLRAVWGRSASDIVAVGNGPSVYRFDGSQWLADGDERFASLPVGAEFHDVWATADQWFATVQVPPSIEFPSVRRHAVTYNGQEWVLDSALSAAVRVIGGSESAVYAGGGTSGNELYVRDPTQEALADRWQPVTQPMNDRIVGIAAAGGFVYVVGSTGSAVRSADGIVWEPLFEPDTSILANVEVRSVAGSPDRMVAVGDDGLIVELYPDVLTVTSPTDRDLGAVVVDGSAFSVVTTFGQVMAWRGIGWTESHSPGLEPFSMSDGILAAWSDGLGTTYAVGFDPLNVGAGFVARRSLGHWQHLAVSVLPPASIVRYKGVWGSSADNVVVVGDRGPLLAPDDSFAYRFDGEAWDQLARSPAGKAFQWVTGDDAHVWLGGTGGAITRLDWDKNAEDWSLDSDVWVNAGWRSDTTLYVATQPAGFTGQVLRNDGSGWQDISLPDQAKVYSLWGLSDSNLYAGATGRLWNFDGSTWTMVHQDEVNSRVWSISGTRADDIFAVFFGSTSTIYHYDGVAWSPMELPKDEAFRRVFAAPGQVLVSGPDAPLETLLRY